MKCRQSTAVILGIWMLYCICGCAPDRPIEDTEIAFTSGFDRPQALLFRDEQLLIGNSGYRANGWEEGSITFMNTDRNEIMYEHQTTALNPQQIKVLESWSVIVETGRYDFSDFETPKSISPFGIELLEHNEQSLTTSRFIELPSISDSGPISAPVDIATIDHVSVVTSGITNAIWRIEWANIDEATVDEIQVVPLEQVSDTGLGSVVVWQQHFLVLDFNSDQIYVLDRSADRITCSQHLGTDPTLIEGLQTPVIVDDELYVTFAFSGQVRRLELSPLIEDCTANLSTLDIILGQVPNDMDQVGDELWITHSGENHILRVNLQDQSRQSVLVLPVSSNPWHFEANTQSKIGAISLWNLNAIGLVKLPTTPTETVNLEN